jgi:protocatechuate 3,4-dioxygenase beta subunit
MAHLLPAALAISVTLVAAFEQARPARFREPPPLNPGTSSIHGRVVDAQSGKPIEGAEVRLIDSRIEQETTTIAGRPITTRRFVRVGKTLTGGDGSYRFDDISDGAYRLFVTHRMYLLPCMGPPIPRSQCDVITVVTDQRIDDANVSLALGAIIRGRVLDKAGQPIWGARVSTEFDQPLANQGGSSATSGADGRFEITSVSPGQVLIRVDPPGARLAWHRVFYYPGVQSRAQAQPVTAEVGAPVDIEIRARDNPVATIRTTLSGPRGFRLQKMTLATPYTNTVVNMKVSGAGTAVVTDLLEGRYVIAARARAGSRTLAAYQLIIIGVGQYEVPMRLEPTARVRGRVVVDTGGVPPVAGVSVEAHWVSGKLKLDPAGPDRSAVRRNGSFTMQGLFGRRQFQLSGLSDEWRVTALRAGGSDVTSGIDLAPGSTTEITIVVSRK